MIQYPVLIDYINNRRAVFVLLTFCLELCSIMYNISMLKVFI